ncbi:hypothetical protein DMC25_18235 [Caulobacter sp. D4A]|uniref:type II toxin-antitoxin system RelE/ParE family toxin n=1 Tax=unclassified Caulobacter TaxID=2648921 RepID=UPI000D731D1D|nr:MULTISPECIES: type II toxin-antitoxin system RelE/ParE family toxin [unclassified Caulobacter]PXA83290.1 hypothetical protein DMC25_18235 [Caulobacter sp. D4A]PXA88595.1 hypothetical protein DMC18_18780 [Caulobacter sp. D5]
MVGGRIERSSRARSDALKLSLWITRESGIGRARAVSDRLEAALEMLARRPLLGRPRPDFPATPRSFSVPPWVIVYRPLPDQAGILVLRILDSRQDIAALMGKKS